MKKFFGKFPIVAIAIVVGVCSVSLTAYAYYRLTLTANVGVVQTASFEMLVKVVPEDTQVVDLLEEEENYIKYTFSGKEGTKGVTFCIVGVGTASSGYCEVVVTDADGTQESYYTQTIGANDFAAEDGYYFTILGNKDNEVRFIARWGMHEITDEALIIDKGEAFGTYEPVATASPSPSPSISPSPSTSATPSPAATPSPTTEDNTGSEISETSEVVSSNETSVQ